MDIYRSTRDADLVIDGDRAAGEKIEALIKYKLAHLQGATLDWEVRLLREARGAKQALLSDRNFLQQHSDSHSTGLIELTDFGETTVRDVFDWDAGSAPPRFLRDVASGKLHYYHSLNHRRTDGYLAGNNPEIFSVIRYFMKLFQYGLDPEPDDLAKLQAIINHFTPAEITTDYAVAGPRKTHRYKYSGNPAVACAGYIFRAA